MPSSLNGTLDHYGFRHSDTERAPLLRIKARSKLCTAHFQQHTQCPCKPAPPRTDLCRLATPAHLAAGSSSPRPRGCLQGANLKGHSLHFGVLARASALAADAAIDWKVKRGLVAPALEVVQGHGGLNATCPRPNFTAPRAEFDTSGARI